MVRAALMALVGDRRVRALLLGQVIAALIAGTGVFSTSLADRGVNIPTAQSTLNYLLLLVFLARRVQQRGTKPLLVPWWRYALLAAADVEANFFIVKAYQYTTITSVMLLDCFTIPVVMLLSYRFLGTRYTRAHFLGVGLCLLGIVALVASDVLAPPQPTDSSADGGGGGGGGEAAQQSAGAASSDALFGDLLCLVAATLYAVSNVGQEILVKTHDRVEFLGLLGLFGSLLSGVQVALVESDALAAVEWSPAVVGHLAGFALCLFVMYTLTSRFLQSCDSTLFNLSLLGSDVWAVVAAYALFGASLSPLYFVAAALIVAGLVVYNRVPPQSAVLRRAGEGEGDGDGAVGGGGDVGGGGGGGEDDGSSSGLQVRGSSPTRGIMAATSSSMSGEASLLANAHGDGGGGDGGGGGFASTADATANAAAAATAAADWGRFDSKGS
jgi:solute carrier family 35 protein F1/2